MVNPKIAIIWKINKWSPKARVIKEITTDGITMPVIRDDKLNVKNLVNKSLTLVIFSLANVQTLFQIKLEIMANSAAIALLIPFNKLIFESGVIIIDLNTLAP
jgi:hypothetical protein